MILPYKFRRLPMSIDPRPLQIELAAIPKSWWTVHRFHDSTNEAVPLITCGGMLLNEDGSDNHSLLPPFAATKRLAQLPCMRELLYSFGVEPSRARLMLLRPGQAVRPHQDRNPHWYDKVRVHIPIRTRPEVLFRVWTDEPRFVPEDCETVHMAAGEVWVFNNWYHHMVSNDSTQTRVHLVVDLKPEGVFGEQVFAEVSSREREAATHFSYPPYRVDSETLMWMTGGNIEKGINSWKAIVDDAAQQGTTSSQNPVPPADENPSSRQRKVQEHG